MAVYQSAEQLNLVLNDVFTAVAKLPDKIETFTRSNLVIRIRFTDPESEILVDGRQPPVEIFFGPRPGRVNLDAQMAADTLHEIWIGRVSFSSAFFGGHIKTKGNLMKAMKLVDLFRACEGVYPAIAAKHGLM